MNEDPRLREIRELAEAAQVDATNLESTVGDLESNVRVQGDFLEEVDRDLDTAQETAGSALSTAESAFERSGRSIDQLESINAQLSSRIDELESRIDELEGSLGQG